ncbi:MAG TPA: prolipoprotein diacylglyceryl transferase family protein [Anaerolineaceae bacterium]|nr:prolipoprotein diacylglyceryl transferase family protein [Anaerolineaceae bacterium]
MIAIIFDRGVLLNWYAFLIGIGTSLALLRVFQEQKVGERVTWAIAALWLLLGAWLGARIAFFIWQPAAILDFGWQAFGLREGGMVWSGAVFGAWISVWILSLAKGKSFLETADRLLIMLPPLVIMSWLAGWFSGSGYGQIMSSTWWIPITLDDHFEQLPRFPLQMVAAFSIFLLFLLFELRVSMNKTGMKAAIIWSIFSVHTLIFSFLRADLRPEWMGIPWDIWFVFLCLFWALILVWTAYFYKPEKKTTQ